MFENCTMLPTVNMPRDQWLAERRKGLGGSDAAAVVGMSQWATPYTVYMDKLGLLPEKEDTEAMRQGRDLEDYVARRFAEATGKRVRRCNYMIRNSRYPFALADFDRVIIGQDAGLECKVTADLRLRNFSGNEFPSRYYAQCVHYLAVTGASKWFLAVLVLGSGFHVFELHRDEAEISALMNAEEQLWRRIEARDPPDMTGADAEGTALDSGFPSSADQEVELFGLDDLFRELEMADKALQSAQQVKNRLINVIKSHMRQADRAVCGDYRVTWRQQTRKVLDMDALREAHPEVQFDEYMKVTTSRPFRWRGPVQ